jgi:EmrB/QacA subfamily drug resistance transporter
MSPPTGPARPSLTRTQVWTLGAAGTGSFMVVLDLLAVSTALPEIHSSLRASVGTLAWTVSAYTLSFAVLLVTAATLGDRWGRRNLYAGGLALFALSSVACALAPDIATLLAARVVQGAGAAVIMPLALALLNAAFPPQRRGWAMGIYGSITGLGTVAGPVLGGALTQALSWRWIFWINVPVGLLAIGAVLRFVADSRGARRPIDPLALLLAIVSGLGIVWAIIRAATSGWSDRAVLGALAIGLVALGALLAWQRRATHPMIPLRLFRNGVFAAGNAAIFAQNASLTAAVFFTAQFFQNSQGYGPLPAGVRLLPVGAVPLLTAARSGATADRFGPRPLVLAGLTLQAGGIAALASLGAPHRSYLILAGPLILLAVGLTLALPALTKAVVGSVEPGDIGVASGLFTTLRQLGGAFGVAVSTTAFTAVGGYADAVGVARGYDGAMYVAALLAVLGSFSALGLGSRQRRVSRCPAPGHTGSGTSELLPGSSRGA